MFYRSSTYIIPESTSPFLPRAKLNLTLIIDDITGTGAVHIPVKAMDLARDLVVYYFLLYKLFSHRRNVASLSARTRYFMENSIHYFKYFP